MTQKSTGLYLKVSSRLTADNNTDQSPVPEETLHDEANTAANKHVETPSIQANANANKTYCLK